MSSRRSLFSFCDNAAPNGFRFMNGIIHTNCVWIIQRNVRISFSYTTMEMESMRELSVWNDRASRTQTNRAAEQPSEMEILPEAMMCLLILLLLLIIKLNIWSKRWTIRVKVNLKLSCESDNWTKNYVWVAGAFVRYMDPTMCLNCILYLKNYSPSIQMFKQSICLSFDAYIVFPLPRLAFIWRYGGGWRTRS